MSWAVACNTANINPIVNSNRSAVTFTGTLAPGALMVLFCAGCIGWMFYDIQQQSQQQTPPTFRTPGAPQKKF